MSIQDKMLELTQEMYKIYLELTYPDPTINTNKHSKSRNELKQKYEKHNQELNRLIIYNMEK